MTMLTQVPSFSTVPATPLKIHREYLPSIKGTVKITSENVYPLLNNSPEITLPSSPQIPWLTTSITVL